MKNKWSDEDIAFTVGIGGFFFILWLAGMLMGNT